MPDLRTVLMCSGRTDEDADKIINAFKKSLMDMKEDGMAVGVQCRPSDNLANLRGTPGCWKGLSAQADSILPSKGYGRTEGRRQ